MGGRHIHRARPPKFIIGFVIKGRGSAYFSAMT
jgi:hypothetical protein